MLLTAQGCARLRTGPIIMEIPRGYEKKSLLCRKSAILSIRWKKTHFGLSQRLKKVLLTAQGCARLRKAAEGCARLQTGPIILEIPRGYQKKKFIV